MNILSVSLRTAKLCNRLVTLYRGPPRAQAATGKEYRSKLSPVHGEQEVRFVSAKTLQPPQETRIHLTCVSVSWPNSQGPPGRFSCRGSTIANSGLLEDSTDAMSFVIRRLKLITPAIRVKQAPILPHIMPHKRESRCPFTAIYWINPQPFQEAIPTFFSLLAGSRFWQKF